MGYGFVRAINTKAQQVVNRFLRDRSSSKKMKKTTTTTTITCPETCRPTEARPEIIMHRRSACHPFASTCHTEQVPAQRTCSRVSAQSRRSVSHPATVNTHRIEQPNHSMCTRKASMKTTSESKQRYTRRKYCL